MADEDSLKLPKKIAGVKVPKFLRHPGTFPGRARQPGRPRRAGRGAAGCRRGPEGVEACRRAGDEAGESGGNAAREEAPAADDLAGEADVGSAGRRPGRGRKAARDKTAAGPSTH